MLEDRPQSENSEINFEEAAVPIEAERMKTEYECKGITIQVHYIK